jgi:hypothetical protein
MPIREQRRRRPRHVSAARYPRPCRAAGSARPRRVRPSHLQAASSRRISSPFPRSRRPSPRTLTWASVLSPESGLRGYAAWRSRIPVTGPAARTPAERPQSPDARQRARRRSLGKQSSTSGASMSLRGGSRCCEAYAMTPPEAGVRLADGEPFLNGPVFLAAPVTRPRGDELG